MLIVDGGRGGRLREGGDDWWMGWVLEVEGGGRREVLDGVREEFDGVGEESGEGNER